MITKSIKERIKEYYFLYPNEKLRVRGMEKKIRIPLPSAIRYAKELVKEGFLKTTEISGAVFYTANRSSPVFLLEKKLYNLKAIYESCLIGYLEERLGDPGIILFGSYAKGEDIETSDIDIYVETSIKTKVELSIYEKRLSRKTLLFIHKNIREIKNKDLANNI